MRDTNNHRQNHIQVQEAAIKEWGVRIRGWGVTLRSKENQTRSTLRMKNKIIVIREKLKVA